MKDREKADLLKELALLLKAGIPLAKSIEILSEGKLAPRARQILKKLHEGVPLSETLDWGGEIKALIGVGEQNGFLEESLERSAGRIEARLRFKQSIRRSLSYPALVLFLSLTIETFRFPNEEDASSSIRPEREGSNLLTRAIVTCGVNCLFSRRIPIGTRLSSIMPASFEHMPPSCAVAQITRGCVRELPETPETAMSNG